MQATVGKKELYKIIIDLLIRVFISFNFLFYYIFSFGCLLYYGIGTKHIVYTLPIAINVYIFSTVIHEFGHLLFGWYDGFQVFRIGVPFLVIYKTKENWKLRLNREGNSYCYMVDKKTSSHTLHYILYYLGGSLGNFICVIVMCFIQPNDIIQNLLWLGVIVYNLGKGIRNLIPNMKKKYSDGTVVLCLLRDGNNRNMIKAQMDVEVKLQMGMGIHEIDIINEVYKVKRENDLSFFVHMINYYIYLEREMYLSAENEIRLLNGNLNSISIISRQQLLKEQLFIYSIQNKMEANASYYEMIKKIKQHNFDYYCSLYCYMKYSKVNSEYAERIKMAMKKYTERFGESEYIRIKNKIMFG